MSACRARERGLTLLELLVALGVSAIAIAAAMSLLIQQQRSYATTSADRAQQEAGQLALKELTARLKLAGFGVDPNLAIDVGEQQLPIPREGAPTNAVAMESFKCKDPIACRDSTKASDELVFYSRNPMFSRVITNFDTGSLTFVGSLKKPIYQGQIVQVMCLGESQARGYATVSKTVMPSGKVDPTEKVTLELAGPRTVGSARVFPYENDASLVADTCWKLTEPGNQPVATLVDRWRFYVGWYDEGGKIAVAQAEGARPYLMLDKGIFDENGAEILLPVAPDVEDLQVAYYFRPAAALGPMQVAGAEQGTAASDDKLPLTVKEQAPDYTDTPDAATRNTGHPNNVRGVRVGVVIRSPEKDLSAASLPDRTLPPLLNRVPFEGAPYYRRTTFETTVLVRNLQSTYFPYTQTIQAGVADPTGLNQGGG